MSTKAIREALDAAAMAAPDTSNEDLARKVLAAWPEVEAIEEAAQAACDTGATAHMRERGHGVSAVVLQKIAKDAP